MKLFDKVRILANSPEYAKEDVYQGMIGTIIDAEIQFRAFQLYLLILHQQLRRIGNI